MAIDATDREDNILIITTTLEVENLDENELMNVIINFNLIFSKNKKGLQKNCKPIKYYVLIKIISDKSVNSGNICTSYQ